ncbi:hypothetical protein PoB_006293800 [Plakobranchus ocellatus]|uniref:Secreted protein n=1 Tax=Plakobranchus ocellatus TaxID=259542 RepID=A0AAV4CX27_9GAST|nr:hypothetical protein PoB_006293800 [Plakobranchus ocellatus]
MKKQLNSQPTRMGMRKTLLILIVMFADNFPSTVVKMPLCPLCDGLQTVCVAIPQKDDLRGYFRPGHHWLGSIPYSNVTAYLVRVDCKITWNTGSGAF